jgi:ABC-type multidrug transport system ATPase subunit
MQRIGLARALFGSPRFVVLDEPNANLDAEGEAQLLLTLKSLREQGTTLVLITHKPAILKELDKILLMREGRAELFGPRNEVAYWLRKPAFPVSQKPGNRQTVMLTVWKSDAHPLGQLVILFFFWQHRAVVIFEAAEHAPSSPTAWSRSKTTARRSS